MPAVYHGAGTADSVRRAIEQIAHGFSVGQAVYYDAQTSPNTWRLAQADDKDTLRTAVVDEVTDADSCSVIFYGMTEWPAHGYIVGDDYYLSDTVPGGVTNIEPNTIGTYVQVVFKVIDPDYVKILDQAVIENN